MRILQVTTKKRSPGKQPITIGITDAESRKGTQQALGGSQSHHWNLVLLNQAANTLWTRHSDEEGRERQYNIITLTAPIQAVPRKMLSSSIVAPSGL
jgi:hypothetical protein